MSYDNWQLAYQLLPKQLLNTIYMVVASAFFACIIGIPLGVILAITDRGQIKTYPTLNRTVGAVVNIVRSFPFAILMVVLIPLTRLMVGTSLGTTASIVPLTIAAAPFVARLIENAIKEVSPHLVEAASVMGSNTWQIVTKVLMPEALPSIVKAITTTFINLVGYSAMAGLIGGGGLGQIAIQYGYNRFNTFIMIATVVLLILLVQMIQWIGQSLSSSILKKRGLLLHA